MFISSKTFQQAPDAYLQILSIQADPVSAQSQFALEMYNYVILNCKVPPRNGSYDFVFLHY